MVKDLMREISYKKSWGRNQILKLNSFDKTLLSRVSYEMETPNANRGTILKIIAEINSNKNVLVLSSLDKIFYSSCDNMSKDFVISCCLENNLDSDVLKLFSDKLRFKNSKRHLRDKLYMSYFESL